MVVQPQVGVVLSVADDKVKALVDARRVLAAASDLIARETAEQLHVQGQLWPDGEMVPAIGAKPRHVSRRRRNIFQRSQGRCLYCKASLELEGEWHVEHQLPRALGGGDDALNLVASCVRCNLGKGDRTAIEFLTGDERTA